MKTKRSLAISEILILVLGIIAMGYAIGSSIGVVSAADACYENYKSGGCDAAECDQITNQVGVYCGFFEAATPYCANINSLVTSKYNDMKNDANINECSDCGSGLWGSCSSKVCFAIGEKIGTRCVAMYSPFNLATLGISCDPAPNLPLLLNLGIPNPEPIEQQDFSNPSSSDSSQNQNNGQDTPQENPQPSLQDALGYASTASSLIPVGKKKLLETPDFVNYRVDANGNKIYTYSGLEEGSPFPDDDITYGATLHSGEASGNGLLGLKGWWNGNLKPALGNIIKNAAIAGTIYLGIELLGPLVTSDKKGIDAAAKAAMIGYMAATSVDEVVSSIVSKSAGKAVGDFLGKKIIFGITGTTFLGAGIAIVYFLATYKKETEQHYTFSCYPWEAPLGGADCEQCNGGLFPCTEYQCKSLGQACELENQGTTEEICVWRDRHDTTPPVITPWKEVLSEKFTYNPDNKISPPDRGVYIKYDFGCVPAFTAFTFGFQTNEPAKCKADVERKESFDEMAYYFGGSTSFRYNHTETLGLPSKEAIESENQTLKNNGNYEIFVRCIDVNGNPVPESKSASFVFKYCVDPGPDTTAPKIMSTSINSGEPVAFNTENLDLQVNVNEPAECRWTRDKDKDFSTMEGSMTCATSPFQMNAQMTYKCTTTLTGIKNRQENKFFFRCKDKPKAIEKNRYANSQGYPFTIIGTEPLLITGAGPNGTTIRGTTDSVEITLTAETFAGAQEGKAVCYFSESCWDTQRSKEKYTQFRYEGENSNSHSQTLNAPQGNYQCSIQCIDRGGNLDQVEINYKVEVDKTPPAIVRAFQDQGYLKIITNEDGQCVYSNTDCIYEFDADGLPMSSLGTEHYTEWKTDKNFYIKCKDTYGNYPDPNQCTIVVRPLEFFER